MRGLPVNHFFSSAAATLNSCAMNDCKLRTTRSKRKPAVSYRLGDMARIGKTQESQEDFTVFIKGYGGSPWQAIGGWGGGQAKSREGREGRTLGEGVPDARGASWRPESCLKPWSHR